MTEIAFHLPDPFGTLYHFEQELVGSLTRPLLDADYYQASHHPKDLKQLDNTLTSGVSYFVRHAKRSRKAGDRKGAKKHTALALACTPVMLLSFAAGNLPATLVAYLRRCFPFSRRSDDATRENSIAIAIYEYSLIIGSFAYIQQYDGPDGRLPLTMDDLRHVYDDSGTVVGDLQNFMASATPRIRDSSMLPRKIGYLQKRRKDLHERIQQNS